MCGVFYATGLAIGQPIAWNRCAEPQFVSSFLDEHHSQPKSRIGFVGGFVVVATLVADVGKRVLGHHPRIRPITYRKGVEIGAQKMLRLISQQIWNRIAQQVRLHGYAAPAEPIAVEFFAGDIIAILLGDVEIVLEVLDDPGGHPVPGSSKPVRIIDGLGLRGFR